MKLSEITLGMEVRYSHVIGEKHDGNIYKVRDFGTMPSGHDVAWLVGKCGCVAVEALTKVEKANV